MSTRHPNKEFFLSLQQKLNSDPDSTKDVDPSDAYCGFEVGDHLFVLEFDGRECSAVVAGGNTLDLDFVVAGSVAVWQQAIEAIESDDADVSLPALIEHGDLEIRSVDDAGFEIARASLPMLQVFLEGSRGLDFELD